MAACRKCGEKIDFNRVGGKWHPTNEDGTQHWKSCRAKNELEIRRGPTITGREYRSSCERCNVPNWEECACSFTAAERANQEADERMALVLTSEG